MVGAEELARLLEESRGGCPEAGARVYEIVRDQLHALASRNLRGQRADHTLQATALVNEAWMRLFAPGGEPYRSRGHFLAVAARAMRSVLVDHARRKRAQRRGGDRERLVLDEAMLLFEARSTDLLDREGLLDLEHALEQLAAEHPRRARVVELRFFGGLSVPEVAEALELSVGSVERDWRLARLWLLRALGQPPPASGAGTPDP